MNWINAKTVLVAPIAVTIVFWCIVSIGEAASPVGLELQSATSDVQPSYGKIKVDS